MVGRIGLSLWRGVTYIARRYVYSYALVAHKKTFYIFEGRSIITFSTVTKKWKKTGELKTDRIGHEAIVRNDEFIIVGGNRKIHSERCTFNDESIECKLVTPELLVFDTHELMLVPSNYCPK